MAQATPARKETTKKQKATASVPRSKAVSEPSLNMNELRELAALVNENGFTDFEFENANIRVRLSKNPAPQFVQSMPQQFASAPPAQTQSALNTQTQSEASSKENSVATQEEDNLHKITSPIVGTFYSSPAPDID